MPYMEYSGEDFEELVKEGVTIIDIYSDHCGPCKMIEPIFEKLSNEIKDVKFVKMNLPNHVKVAYSICGAEKVPSLVMYKNGEKLELRLGFQPEEVLRKWIESIK